MHSSMLRMVMEFSGFNNWPVQSNMAATVDFASGYRNSAAMHESVDDSVKPVSMERVVCVSLSFHPQNLWRHHICAGANNDRSGLFPVHFTVVAILATWMSSE